MLLLLSLFFVSLCVAGQYPLPPNPDCFLYKQTLDHNADDGKTFAQRVLFYDEFIPKSGQPNAIFFCCGGESDVRGGWDHNGNMFDMAKQLGALLVYPEHRFYGNSVPTTKLYNNVTVDSKAKCSTNDPALEQIYLNQLGFLADTVPRDPSFFTHLTIQQAIEDYIIVLRYIKQIYKIDSSVPTIAFGGSYPGMLSSFMRSYYPKEITGALAASAPLLYRPSFTPGGAFYAVCTKNFVSTKPTRISAADILVQAFADLITADQNEFSLSSLADQDSTSTSPLSWLGALNALRICSNTNPPNLRLVQLWLENAFADMGMENYPYAVGGLPANPMKYAADACISTYERAGEGDPYRYLKGAAATASVAYNTTQDLECFDISEEYYECADITGCGGGDNDQNALSWDYQSCTQIVSNVDTNGITDMFSKNWYDIDALTAYCKKRWNTIPDNSDLIERYPVSSMTKVIFSNGAIDPWYPGGVYAGRSTPPETPRPEDIVITSDDEKDVTSILIGGSAHHLDLRKTVPSDPKGVIKARGVEYKIISRWIKEYRKNN